MPRRAVKLSFAHALLFVALGCATGCEGSDLPDDPDLGVPGHDTIPPAPPPTMPTPGSATEFTPPLAVPHHDEIPPPPMPAGMMPPGGQMPPGAQVPPGGMRPNMAPSGPIALAAGFQPDPLVLRGMAGGAVPARSMNPQCLGTVGSQPNHILQVTGPIQNLRIMVNGMQANGQITDMTLVIRAPNGTFLCNDDFNTEINFNPLIQGAFQPGGYQIWVGLYNPVQPVPYAIAFTENPAMTPEQVR